MRAKTSAGSQLKRLAKRYAEAFADLVLIGGRHPDEHAEIRQQYAKARKKLYERIDSLTSIDLTPRSVHDE